MFVPFNRHLLVEPIKGEDRDEVTVLIPESSLKKSPWTLVRLVAVAADCEKFTDLNGVVGSTLVVNTSMIEDVQVGSEKFNLILENHVMGLYTEA